MEIKCEICGHDVEIYSNYGSGYCKKCFTEYEYAEGFRIVLDDDDRAILKSYHRYPQNQAGLLTLMSNLYRNREEAN